MKLKYIEEKRNNNKYQLQIQHHQYNNNDIDDDDDDEMYALIKEGQIASFNPWRTKKLFDGVFLV